MKIRHLPVSLENFCLSFPGIYRLHFRDVFFSAFFMLLIFNANFLEAQQQCIPVILVDWPVNTCYAGSHADSYSEFVPVHNKSGGCTKVDPTVLYKRYGNHACGIGRTGGDGTSMVLGGFTNTGFYANSRKALRFKVEFGPNDDGFLYKLSFWNEAKSRVYANGSTYPYGNDYPTKFGVRALKNGVEIFRQTGLSTNSTWTKRHIDLSSDPDFAYSGTTVFEFELYAYSPVGNGYPNHLWNLDEFSLWGCCDGCDNVTNAGVIAANQSDCESFDPAPLTSTTPAHGGSGSPLEYLWQKRNVGSSAWTDIPGTNLATYDPPLLTASTEFRRLAKRTLCPDYLASNTVTITVNDPPDVSASVSGPITCRTGTVQLLGNSTNSNVTYSWTGPGGFVSNKQNPYVQEVGTYTLTVTDKFTGCSASAQTWVLENKNIPSAFATGGQIDCVNNSVRLFGRANPRGVSYEWQGPNGFQVYAQNVDVSEPGTYLLIVMDTLNGCKDTAYATVTSDIDLPGATASGGTIGCTQNSVQLTGNSSTSGVSYSWTGPGGFTSSEQNPTVSVAGTYTLTVTNPLNQCTSTATAVVNEDSNLPGATATGGSITCTQSSVQLTGSSAASGVSFSWVGPGGFTSNQQNPVVSAPGTYTLTVTNPGNGCTSTDMAVVSDDQDLPGAVATGGSITCTQTSVQLMGSSGTAGVSYSWTGPGGFASNQQNPLVSTIGTYTLTVTNPSTGCSSTTTATVTEDSDLPGATAIGGTITCLQNSIQLMGSSGTAGVSYSWTGPGGFTSNQQNPTVSITGTYTLTVTNPANGCTSTSNAIVNENTSLPGAVATGGTISCTENTVMLMGSSGTVGVSYNWTGPGGFSSNQQNPTVSVSGTYTLTVTDPANGCSSVDEAMVDEDISLPGAVATGGTISCTQNSLQLMGSSGTAGVSYEWTGPGGFTSNQQNPLVSMAGTYTLTVTDPTNGCTSSDIAVVDEDADLPGAMATGGTITCTQTSVQLTGNSGTTGVNYSWTGPGGFTSNQQNPTVSVVGSYTLTVSNPNNGCTSTDIAVVEEEVNLPGAEATGGTITCATGNLQLTGSSGTVGVNYSWTGPGGFTSSQQNPTVTTAGTYTLTVSDPDNGCTSTDTALVNEDANLPDVVATGGSISCIQNSVQLMGSSTTAGVSYSWTGPGGFTSNQQNPTVSVSGIYTLTVTDANNGCSSSDTALVEESLNPPANVIASGGEIACGSTDVQITGNSTTAGVSFSWTGPGGFTSTLQNPLVSVEGIYTLVVSNPANGCTASDTALVTQEVCGSCLAEAGTLSPVDTCNEICRVGNMANISAVPDGNQVIPAGYDVLYLLVSHPGGVVVQKSSTPSFDVSAPGDYSLHTLVYLPDPDSTDFLDTTLIILGASTLPMVQTLVDGVCADLDGTGITKTVVNCTSPIALDDFNNTVKGVAVSGNVITNDVYPAGTLEADTILVSGPANGTVIMNSDGSYTYTPDPPFVGEDEFTYRVCDNTKCPPVCATATVFIEVLASNSPLNVAPTANSDAAITEEGTPLTLFVLANDFDLNGDLIQNPVPVSSPRYGEAVYNKDGSITYTPNTGFTGEDEFMYAIADGGTPSMTNPAVVSIAVIEKNAGNDAPFAVDDAAATGKNQPVRVNLAANDIEKEGDLLVYKILKRPVNGTVDDFNPMTGIFTYSPKLNFTGADQFVYTVCDDEGCSQATVYFTVIEDQINKVLVEWIRFRVKQYQRDAILKWGTNVEVNSTHFEVERSLDGLAFERVGFVKAAGYSTEPQAYTYTDPEVAALGVNRLFYRIKLIHNDGTYSYSSLEELAILPDPEIGIVVYPNPAHDELTISYSSNEPVGEVLIYNTIGQLMYKYEPKEGTLKEELEMRIGSWATGMYYVQILTIRGNVSQRLLIKPED